MEENLLLNCSVKVLALLIRQYEEGTLPLEEFEKNCRLKIKFILEHMDQIECQRERELVSDILHDYFTITANYHTPFYDYKTGR